MLLHNAPLFKIYFGNAKDNVRKSDYQDLSPDTNLLDREPFAQLKKLMGIEHLIFQHQTHSTDGAIITPENMNAIAPFGKDGDYLITQLSHVGIGILTADCLPIVIYDRKHGAIAVIHAGWRGSVAGIAKIVLERMQKEFGTSVEDIKIFFGPGAKPCCYEVSESFVQQLDDYPFAQECLIEQSDKVFFDVPGFNRLLLESIGVRKESFRFEYNVCTMCDDNFFSYRRQGNDAGRQMTVVALK